MAAHEGEEDDDNEAGGREKERNTNTKSMRSKAKFEWKMSCRYSHDSSLLAFPSGRDIASSNIARSFTVYVTALSSAIFGAFGNKRMINARAESVIFHLLIRMFHYQNRDSINTTFAFRAKSAGEKKKSPGKVYSPPR